MPNHVKNKITGVNAEKVFELLRGDSDQIIDFGKVIPAPAEVVRGAIRMDIEGRAKFYMGSPTLAEIARRARGTGQPSAVLDQFIEKLEAENILRDLARGKYPKDYTDDEFEHLIAIMRSIRATGYTSEMEWSTVHWGTKWNAYGIKLPVFETAWGCPEPVIRAVHERIPEGWEWAYASEDRGYHCGTWQAHHLGLRHFQPAGGKEEAMHLAEALWS